MPRIHVFEAMPFKGRGHSETCYRICRFWPEFGAETRVHTPFAVRSDPAGILSPVLPRALPGKLKYKLADLAGLDRLQRRSERAGLAGVQPGDICYFWPLSSVDAMQAARDRGAHVVVEFINCHVAYARGILKAEQARIGLHEELPLEHYIDGEHARLEAADAAFAPGPFVGPSIRAEFDGTVEILEVAYGADIPSEEVDRSGRDGPVVFLAVGTHDMRKGTQALLDAWEIAGLDAELRFVGRIHPFFADRVAALADRGVTLAGYLDDPGQAYREADVFVMPTLEEGGPQVTYEAAGWGLPLVVTPMGAGRIGDDSTALVVPPSDAEALAAAFTRLAGDAELRLSLGRAARAASSAYDWRNVAKDRLDKLRVAFW